MGNGDTRYRRKRYYQRNLQKSRTEAARIITLALRFLVYGKNAAGQGEEIRASDRSKTA